MQTSPTLVSSLLDPATIAIIILTIVVIILVCVVVSLHMKLKRFLVGID